MRNFHLNFFDIVWGIMCTKSKFEIDLNRLFCFHFFTLLSFFFSFLTHFLSNLWLPIHVSSQKSKKWSQKLIESRSLTRGSSYSDLTGKILLFRKVAAYEGWLHREIQLY